MKNISNNAKEGKSKQTKLKYNLLDKTPPHCVNSQKNTLDKHAQKKAVIQYGRKDRIDTKKTPKYSCRNLRDTAGKILKMEQRVKDTDLKKDYRVAWCDKRLIPADKERERIQIATIFEHIETKHRIIGGTMKCGSVWLCADCARKITDGRREEIEKGILEADKNGYMVLMITFTHSHHKGDSLKNLLNTSSQAKRNSKSGRKYKDIKKLYKIVGSIVAHEITYGEENGFHPHYHELLILKEKITDEKLKELENTLRDIWQTEAKKQGLTMNEHGFHLTATRGKIEDYIAKWGREPQDPNKIWGVSEEMVKGQMKQARRIEGLTPFGMLALIKYLEELDEQTEEAIKRRLHYEKLFKEYAGATLGRQQVRWSKGLKKDLGIKEVTDQELVEEYKEKCEPIAGMLSPAWIIAVTNNLIEEILKMDMVEMKMLLCSLGADPKTIILYRQEDIFRWSEIERELAPDTDPPAQARPPESEQIIYTAEPNEQELDIIETLKSYNVRFIAEPCEKCGSHLKRNVLGDIECCNCSTSPLWSNQTIKRIGLISLERKRTRLKAMRIA